MLVLPHISSTPQLYGVEAAAFLLAAHTQETVAATAGMVELPVDMAAVEAVPEVMQETGGTAVVQPVRHLPAQAVAVAALGVAILVTPLDFQAAVAVLVVLAFWGKAPTAQPEQTMSVISVDG